MTGIDHFPTKDIGDLDLALASSAAEITTKSDLCHRFPAGLTSARHRKPGRDPCVQL